MEIIGAIAGFYLAVLNPQWFDKGPYEFVSGHPTIVHCQNASKKGDICTTEDPIQQYRKVQNFKEDYSNTADLEWVECDHVLGCYSKPGVHTQPNRRNNGLKYGMKSLVFNPQEKQESYK